MTFENWGTLRGGISRMKSEVSPGMTREAKISDDDQEACNDPDPDEEIKERKPCKHPEDDPELGRTGNRQGPGAE